MNIKGRSIRFKLFYNRRKKQVPIFSQTINMTHAHVQ